MDETMAQLLRVVIELEQCGDEVRSLFHLANETDVDYRWSWHCLKRAEERGLVTVIRQGPGVPLRIASTDQGRAFIAQRDDVSPKWQQPPI
jgi:hypothetical protein